MTPFKFHTLLSTNFHIVCKFNAFQLAAEPSSLAQVFELEETKLNENAKLFVLKQCKNWTEPM